MMMMMKSLSGFTFVVLVFLSSLSYAQPFEEKLVPGIYSNNNFVNNLKPNQAILSFTKAPNGNGVSVNDIFTVEDISKGVLDVNKYRASAITGRYYVVDDVRYEISLIDEKYIYVTGNSNATANVIIPRLQEQLISKGLGTVQQRQNYITFLSTSFGIKPFNFTLNLKSWIIVGLVLFLSLPMWYIFKRFLRQ